MEKTVGVIGGIGPLSTVYFMDMLVRMTDAVKDQEHINSVVFNHSTIPDRTRYILGLSEENPLTVMVDDAKKLENIGVDFIVIPCNTAHYFFKSIKENISIPMLNIVEEAVLFAKERGIKKLGVMATDGTVISNTYQSACEEQGIECVVPDSEHQKSVMSIIYDDVKAGNTVDMVEFMRVVGYMRECGCEAVVCGCTELSVIYKDYNLDKDFFIDSLEVLARRTIEMCGKNVKEEYLVKDRVI